MDAVPVNQSRQRTSNHHHEKADIGELGGR